MNFVYTNAQYRGLADVESECESMPTVIEPRTNKSPSRNWFAASNEPELFAAEIAMEKNSNFSR